MSDLGICFAPLGPETLSRAPASSPLGVWFAAPPLFCTTVQEPLVASTKPLLEVYS